MCGRFALIAPPKLVAEYFNIAAPTELTPQYNIAPGQTIAAIHLNHEQPLLKMMRWGFVPAWNHEEKPKLAPINAKLETMQTKPFFKEAAMHHRCLIPATGYYEWRQLPSGKQPYFTTQSGKFLMALAGIYAEHTWEKHREYRVAIVTQNAHPTLQHIHPRMPVIIHPRYFADWLEDKPLASLAQLEQENYHIPFDHWPVTPQMNSPSFDTPACLKPIVIEGDPV